MSAPLYRSFRDSFSKDICHAVTPVIAAPVIAAELRSAADLALLCADEPPQNVLIHTDSRLDVIGADGAVLAPLRGVLERCTRSVPVIFADSFSAVGALRDFLFRECVMDVILAAAWADSAVLAAAYEAIPTARGLLDCRGLLRANPDGDIRDLAGELTACGAENVLFLQSELTREKVHALRRRFIHVWCDAAGGDIYDAITLGVNGILTGDPAAAYRALDTFPENTFTSRRCLYAHKGFQFSGKYSENTISGVRAAGQYGFDGAEIDVKLTADMVPVVMHNLNTRGLFDCPEMVTEEVPYAALEPLRRIGFPDEGVDKFDDLMREMAAYPDTPVVIEFKPREKYHRVEELVRQTKELLRRPDVQRACLGIMGDLTPGLPYVHRMLPFLPLSYVEGGKEVPPAPATRAEAEDRLFRIARLLAGTAAGYNPEDVNLNRLFNEYAKFRGLNVVVWSRSWTLAPSTWEEHGIDNDRTYMAGYDGWTTDHGDMYLDLPVEIEVPADFPREIAAGTEEFVCDALLRDGRTVKMPAGAICAEGSLTEPGTARILLVRRCDLHFGDFYTIVSRPVTVLVTAWPGSPGGQSGC